MAEPYDVVPTVPKSTGRTACGAVQTASSAAQQLDTYSVSLNKILVAGICDSEQVWLTCFFGPLKPKNTGALTGSIIALIRTSLRRTEARQQAPHGRFNVDRRSDGVRQRQRHHARTGGGTSSPLSRGYLSWLAPAGPIPCVTFGVS